MRLARHVEKTAQPGRRQWLDRANCFKNRPITPPGGPWPSSDQGNPQAPTAGRKTSILKSRIAYAIHPNGMEKFENKLANFNPKKV
jgi:hypothetical protein